jgi:hypothetical protein
VIDLGEGSRSYHGVAPSAYEILGIRFADQCDQSYRAGSSKLDAGSNRPDDYLTDSGRQVGGSWSYCRATNYLFGLADRLAVATPE